MTPAKLGAILAASAALAIQAFGSCAFAQAQVPIEAQIEALERSWTTQSGAGQYRYFANAGSIASSLSGQEPTEAAGASLRLLDNLLSKQVRSIEVGAADLVARSKVARYILANRGGTPELRRSQAQLLGQLLEQVRGEMKSDYVPKQVSMNVAPRAGGEPRMAGMSPNAIADTAAREEYQQAILQNQADNLTNARQAELRSMDREFGSVIIAQLEERAATGELNAEVMESLLRAPGFSSEERERLTLAVHEMRRFAGR